MQPHRKILPDMTASSTLCSFSMGGIQGSFTQSKPIGMNGPNWVTVISVGLLWVKLDWILLYVFWLLETGNNAAEVVLSSFRYSYLVHRPPTWHINYAVTIAQAARCLNSNVWTSLCPQNFMLQQYIIFALYSLTWVTFGTKKTLLVQEIHLVSVRCK